MFADISAQVRLILGFHLRSSTNYVNVLPMADVRVTVAVARVLSAFLEDAAAPRYGYDLMKDTGFPSGKLYPILARLERAGWLARIPDSNSPRRMYRLTPNGAEHARLELAALRQQLGGSSIRRLRPEGGSA